MSFVIDTNAIIAVISEDDVNHDKAVNIWNFDLRIINEILQDPKIKVIENNIQDIYFAIDHKDYIRHYDDFNDLIILSTARRLGLPLVTFDDELLELYHKFKWI